MDYNARYYDPWLGRFVSADTVVPEYANPQAWNGYSYALNNPLRYVDPTGHQDEPTWWEKIKRAISQLLDIARRQYPDSGYETCGVFGCQTLQGPPQQVLLIGPQEAEHLRQIAQIADQAERVAKLASIFEGTLSAEGDELYTEQNINLTEEHLNRPELDALDQDWAPYNKGMVERQRAISRGEIEATQYDTNWMRHELMEKDLMDAGISYDAAHQQANQLLGVEGDWDLWPTEIIEEYRPWLVGPAWEEPLQNR
jgi:hypothetical protein